jgi:hypothetical protein
LQIGNNVFEEGATAIFIAMKTEAAGSFETLVPIYKTPLWHVAEVGTL